MVIKVELKLQILWAKSFPVDVGAGSRAIKEIYKSIR